MRNSPALYEPTTASGVASNDSSMVVDNGPVNQALDYAHVDTDIAMPGAGDEVRRLLSCAWPCIRAASALVSLRAQWLRSPPADPCAGLC